MPALRRLALAAALAFAAPAGAAGAELPRAAAGEIIYIDFWASWCAPCAASFSWLNRMQEKYASRGLRIVGVGVDTDDGKAERFLKLHPPGFQIVRDAQGALAEQYAVAGMPYALIVDANGTVLHRHAGFIADSTDEYEHAIEAALAAGGMQQ